VPKEKITITRTKISQAVCTLLVVAHAPVLLGVEGRSAVGLPHVVEGGEPDDVGSNGRLHGREGSLLVLDARNGLVVGATLSGPASLGDPDRRIGADGGKLLHRAEEPLTTVLSEDIAIEEGVGVDSNVVRGAAKFFTVGDHGNGSVDSDHLARVTGGFEDASSGGDLAGYTAGRDLALVDNLVTDRDGGESGPVVANGFSEDCELRKEGAVITISTDVEDTSENLQVVLLTNVEDH
jgi:hypothetical protein